MHIVTDCIMWLHFYGIDFVLLIASIGMFY